MPTASEKPYGRLKSALLRIAKDRHFLFFLAVILYTQLSSKISFTGTGSILRLEVPLLLYLYALLHSALKPSRLRAVYAAAPLFMLYAFYDYYYVQFGKIPAFVDIQELPELVNVMPWQFLAATGALILIPLAVLALNFRPTRKTALLALPLAALVACATLLPAPTVGAIRSICAPIVNWSVGRNVARNGRLVMAIHDECRRRVNHQALKGYYGKSPAALKTFLTPELAAKTSKKHVTLVVLESFLDPSLFDALNGKGPFAHPSFEAKYAPAFGLTRSPIFGGGTSQAEFELLCGVPAFRAVESAEFNVFSGSPTYCATTALKELGYRAVATNAYRPDFFNTVKAYESLGFGETYFRRDYPQRTPTYLEPTGEDYMFDGALFKMNLDWLAAQPKDRPLFNYVLGIYGHKDFELDEARFPRRFNLEGVPDELNRIATQYYYRTESLAAYLDGLVKLNPESLIIVVSDHLPPLAKGKAAYAKLKYLGGGEEEIFANRVLVVRDGKAVKPPPLMHYDVPALIFDYLTDGGYCREKGCEFGAKEKRDGLKEDYMTVLGLGAR